MGNTEHIDLFLRYVYDELDKHKRAKVDSLISKDADTTSIVEGMKKFKEEFDIQDIEEHKSRMAERKANLFSKLQQDFKELELVYAKKKPNPIVDIASNNGTKKVFQIRFLIAAGVSLLVLSTIFFFLLNQETTPMNVILGEKPMGGGSSLETLYSDFFEVNSVEIDPEGKIEKPSLVTIQLIVKKIDKGKDKYYYNSVVLTLFTAADSFSNSSFELIELVDKSHTKLFFKLDKKYYTIKENDFEEELQQVNDPDILKYLP